MSYFYGLLAGRCFVPSWHFGDHAGYSRIYTPGADPVIHHAHRLVAKMFLASELYNFQVAHRCGNPSCVNPCHLYAATHQDNEDDKVLHARLGWNRLEFDHQIGCENQIVYYPRPRALSKNPCRVNSRFRGFSNNGECFIADWLPTTYDGYGALSRTERRGERVGLHLLSYQLFIGPITKYEMVSHKCADRRCINPYHLELSGSFDPQVFDERNDMRKVRHDPDRCNWWRMSWWLYK